MEVSAVACRAWGIIRPSLFLATLLVACGTETSGPSMIGPSPPAAGAECTLFASPSGNDANAGSSPATPKTLTGAAAATRPGSVVCLVAGTYGLKSTFYPPTSGTPSAWIVYRNYGDGDVQITWAGGLEAPDKMMIKVGNGKFPSGPAYLEFRGLKLDGQTHAIAGFFCFGSHHLRFINNTVTNTGGAGISTVLCDYITSDRNVIHHNGYRSGWTSGISYNSNQWFDSYPGIHNIISNNIVSGEYDASDKHTDGNGIILDLSNRTYDAGSANTPPVLVINNVVYGNGGRCIHAYTVSNFWIVNNTCYKNGLDLALGHAASLTAHNSKDGYFVNNIAVAWSYKNFAFAQYGQNANIYYHANLASGSSCNFICADSAQFLQADPRFVNPPHFDPALDGQYAAAPDPSEVGDGFSLLPTSPALRAGIDPSTLPGLPPAIVRDLKKYIYRDIQGNQRPPGGRFDVGAYQSTATVHK
jgi:hypothetical protein